MGLISDCGPLSWPFVISAHLKKMLVLIDLDRCLSLKLSLSASRYCDLLLGAIAGFLIRLLILHLFLGEVGKRCSEPCCVEGLLVVQGMLATCLAGFFTSF